MISEIFTEIAMSKLKFLYPITAFGRIFTKIGHRHSHFVSAFSVYPDV